MIKGTIKTIHGVQDIPNTEYQKLIFAIKNNEGYEKREQIFAFELFGDKMDLINNFKEGDQVEVEYNLRVRHWKEDKYFTTLDAWKISKAGAEAPKEHPRGHIVAVDVTPQDDDLPF